MKFVEFEVGQVIEAGPCTLDADAMIAFARRYDPQWFHTDPDAAGRGPFDGLFALGP